MEKDQAIKLKERINRPEVKICIALIVLVAIEIVLSVIVKKHDNTVVETNPAAQTTIVTNEAPSVSIEQKDVSEIPKSNPFAGRYVTYQGITTINKEEATYLINPAENDEDVYMEFIVSENDEVLYSSDLVQAGKGIEVNFSEFLTTGEHKLTITMNPYVLSDGDYLKCPVNNAQEVTANM